MKNIIEQLKKVSFKRNKKDPSIDEKDISHLKNTALEQRLNLISSGVSLSTSTLEIKAALIERATEISKMKDCYKSFSKKDNYPAFLDNLISLHLAISEEINN